MKNALLYALLILSTISLGQNYKLFHANAKKVYTNFPVPDSTFSIVFDSVKLVGTDSVYFNFTQPGNMINSDSCQFWGGQECIKQDRPTWLGSKVVFDNISGYEFFTANGDTLTFHFTVNTGGPVIFYQNPEEKFYITYLKSDTITALNFQDSARFYTIIHTDASGNVINSALNNSQIIIGKNLGMIQFFQVDAFPSLLNPISILGNISPDIGLAKLTNEILYDHTVGDILQFRAYQHYNYGPPEDNYENFIRYTFLSKTITTDSIIYTAAKYIFEKNEAIATNDMVVLKYKKDDFTASIPYDYIQPDWFMITPKLYLHDYCGLKLWTYSTKRNQGLRYCSSENCWGSNDVPGPPPFEETIFTSGLGIYSSIYAEAPMSGTSTAVYRSNTLIYFKKNGISCGTEAILGFDENPESGLLFLVYPIPAKDIITIETNDPKGGIVSIVAGNGMTLLEKQFSGKSTQLDISFLKRGIYLLKLTSNETLRVKKVIIE